MMSIPPQHSSRSPAILRRKSFHEVLTALVLVAAVRVFVIIDVGLLVIPAKVRTDTVTVQSEMEGPLGAPQAGLRREAGSSIPPGHCFLYSLCLRMWRRATGLTGAQVGS